MRGNDAKATLFPTRLTFESKNLVLPATRFSYYGISVKSLSKSIFLSSSKFIVGVPSFGLSSKLSPIEYSEN